MPDADQLNAYLADRDAPCPGCRRPCADTDGSRSNSSRRAKLFVHALFWFTLGPPMLVGVLCLDGAVDFVVGKFPTSPSPGSKNDRTGFPVIEVVDPFQEFLFFVSATTFCLCMARLRRAYLDTRWLWLLLSPLMVLLATIVAVGFIHVFAVNAINS
ncbi:MAG: hypothetical protein AAFY46_15435 [Planctomycetota bacterium]